MSKKKDRQDTNYRYCPNCGGKQIIVSEITRKLKKITILNCYACEKKFRVKEVKR